MLKRLSLSALLLLALSVGAQAQTFCSALIYKNVLTTGEWQNCFQQKQDLLGYTAFNKAGDTMLGRLKFAPSTTVNAGINLGVGVAPTTPGNGDFWLDNSGLHYRVGGVTFLAGVGTGSNTWLALQQFTDNDFALLGSTSGSVKLRAPAVAGTSSIRFPAGTTDFSATGGTSQFVRQSAAGGALDVVRPSASDLSNGVVGSGAVALATSPVFVTPTLGVATATSVNKVAITAPATSATVTVADGQTLTVPTSVSVGRGQIQGTATNDNASAGNIGEYVSTDTPSGSAVSLTTGTNANIASISLTAGDWDVWGTIRFTGNASTTVTSAQASISTTSATLDTTDGRLSSTFHNGAAAFNFINLTANVVPVRLSLSGTTTVYLVAQEVFGTSTSSAYGIIQARRAR